jgi:hypothetical protein
MRSTSDTKSITPETSTRLQHNSDEFLGLYSAAEESVFRVVLSWLGPDPCAARLETGNQLTYPTPHELGSKSRSSRKMAFLEPSPEQGPMSSNFPIMRLYWQFGVGASLGSITDHFRQADFTGLIAEFNVGQVVQDNLP